MNKFKKENKRENKIVEVGIGKIGEWLTARKEASYTVEATFVMIIALFLIGSLLTGAFDIHSGVVGNMILQETIEQTGHMEDGQTANNFINAANRDLKAYFWCGNGEVDIKENGQRLSGSVTGKQDGNISVKKFDPEKFLRLLRAVGV